MPINFTAQSSDYEKWKQKTPNEVLDMINVQQLQTTITGSKPSPINEQ